MKINNFIKSALFCLTVAQSSYAVENLNDFKPHVYGRENVSINMLPGTYIENINYGDVNINDDAFSGFTIGVHNRASLKEIHYKEGDIFWNGGVDYTFGSTSGDNISNVDYNKLDFNLDFGYAFNINYDIFFEISAGGFYNYKMYNTDDETDAVYTDTSETDNTYKFGGTLEAAMGLQLSRKFSTGIIYRLSYEISDKDKNTINEDITGIGNEIVIPLQYDLDRNVGVAFLPSYKHVTDTTLDLDSDEYKFTISFTWLYGF